MKTKKIVVFGSLCCFILTVFIIIVNSQASQKSERHQDYQILVNSLKGDTELVRSMLIAGVDPNTPPGPDDKGMTALMFAAWKGNSEIVDLLLKSKADPNAVSTSGSTEMVKFF